MVQVNHEILPNCARDTWETPGDFAGEEAETVKPPAQVGRCNDDVSFGFDHSLDVFEKPIGINQMFDDIRSDHQIEGPILYRASVFPNGPTVRFQTTSAGSFEGLLTSIKRVDFLDAIKL